MREPHLSETIPVDLFEQEMLKRWESFGNVTNDALQQSWRQMGQIYNEKVQAANDPRSDEVWKVLQPPTGTGKTQGTIVYAAILSDSTEYTHPGMIIVTKRKKDADIIRDGINELAGNPVYAISYHSDNRSTVSLASLGAHPVLIITHTAYSLALDSLNFNASIADTWECFYRFGSSGTRKLVVIDEAFDLVETDEVNADSLRLLLFFADKFRKECPFEVQALETLKAIFEALETSAEWNTKNEMIVVSEPLIKRFAGASGPDFTKLKERLRGARLDKALGKNDAMEGSRLSRQSCETLSAVDSLFKTHIYYSKSNGKPSFNTARLLVPPGTKGAVILDATARCDLLYEVFAKAQVIQPPEGTRSYLNATINVSHGHKVGQREMRANGEEVTRQLINSLNAQFTDDAVRRKVLIVTHKEVEPFLLLPSLAPCFELCAAHWGALDGSNEWRDCDTVVIFGLPYKPASLSANIFMALQGPQSTEWLRNPAARAFKGNRGEHLDVREAMRDGKMLSEILQAINRVCFRKVIDVFGNCPKGDIYILGDTKKKTDALIKGMVSEMPGVTVTDWDYSHQKVKKRGRAGGSYDAAVKAYLGNLRVGDRVSAAQVKGDLHVPEASWSRLLEQLKGADSLGEDVRGMGIVVQVEPKKKTTRVYFSRV